MVLQSLLLIACDLDNVQQTQEAGGRSNGAADPVALIPNPYDAVAIFFWSHLHLQPKKKV